MPPKELRVYLTRGLQGQDDRIDLLTDLFEQSQTITVETANPMLDLISFAQDCTEFWVINAEGANPTPVQNLQDDWPQEEFTNSLGLYPSYPSGSIEPTPSDPQNLDHTTTEPIDMNVAVEYQQHSSSHLNSVAPSTGTNATLQCHGLTPPSQPLPSALYPGDDFRRSSDRSLAGFAYLLPSSAYPDALHFQEYNIGIILLPEWRNRGVAARALHLAMDLAFSQPNVHRIQAQLIDCYKNVQALTLFTRMGFSHEGTRRQSFHCPLTAEWKDVTSLALIVTDWYIHVRDRNGFRSAPHSLWDALFTRHQQEREELLRWEDRLSHRSSSLETIRDAAATPVPRSSRLVNLSDSEDGTVSESGSAVVERPKRKLFEIGINGDGGRKHASDAYDASSSEYESGCDSAAEGSPPKRIRSRAGGPSSATASALPLAIDGLDIDLDSLPGKKSSPTSQMSSGPPAGFGASQTLPTSMPGEEAPTLLHNQSRSPSPSPEPSSAATTPPSEFDSEFELEDGGYTTSSSTSSSPTGWEFVNNDDEFRSNLH